jgi:hypothetical protein
MFKLNTMQRYEVFLIYTVLGTVFDCIDAMIKMYNELIKDIQI